MGTLCTTFWEFSIGTIWYIFETWWGTCQIIITTMFELWTCVIGFRLMLSSYLV